MSITAEFLGGGKNVSKNFVGVAAVGAIVGTAFNTILRPYVRIEEGHEAIRTRGGTVSRYKRGERKGQAKVLGAGPHLVIPFSHKIHEVTTRDQSTVLKDTAIDRDDTQYRVEASAIWHVIPSGAKRRDWHKPWRRSWKNQQVNDYPYRALFETDDIERTVKEYCVDGLRCALTAAGKDNFINSKKMTEATREYVAEDLLRYGVELVRITMGNVSESPADRLGKRISGINSGDIEGAIAGAATLGLVEVGINVDDDGLQTAV